ncbi:hypothetical protein [Lysobacter gummosus]
MAQVGVPDDRKPIDGAVNAPWSRSDLHRCRGHSTWRLPGNQRR